MAALVINRFVYDPQMGAELRRDLVRSRAAGHDLGTVADVLQLRAALRGHLTQPSSDDRGNDSATDISTLRRVWCTDNLYDVHIQGMTQQTRHKW